MAKRKSSSGWRKGGGSRRKGGRRPKGRDALLQTARMDQVMDRLKALDEENPAEKPGVKPADGGGTDPRSCGEPGR